MEATDTALGFILKQRPIKNFLIKKIKREKGWENAHLLTVADPGFSRGVALTPKLGLFYKYFAENCMKMKEFGPRGGVSLVSPLDLPMFKEISGKLVCGT